MLVLPEDLQDAMTLLRRAGAKMADDADDIYLVPRDPNGPDSVPFLRAWAAMLRTSAMWIDLQWWSKMMTKDEILGVVKFNLDIAETYLEDRALVSA